MYNRSVPQPDPHEVPLDLPLERGPLRLADYLRMADEPRCEIWRGHLVLTAAPRVTHQRVSGVLFQLLARYGRRIGGLAVAAPIDVVLADDTIVQPDLLLLTAESLPGAEELIRIVPDLLVEIVSPGQSRRDRVLKLNLYVAAGVPEYWIVDGEERTFEFLVHAEGRFATALPRGGVYRSPTLPGLELDLAPLLARRRRPPRRALNSPWRTLSAIRTSSPCFQPMTPRFSR